MKGPDSFYTPPKLANKLVSYIERQPKKVVDFCVGEGNLLSAIENKYKNIEYYGIDISEEVITNVKVRHCYWHLATADFMKKESMLTVPWGQKNDYDLILMNPPFTCKGSTIYIVNFKDEEYHVSRAMLFLLNAIMHLSDEGCIYAIVPISIARSQKDAKIWSYLEQNYNACVLEECTRAQFEKCTPNVIFVYLSKKYPHSRAKGHILSMKFHDLPVSQCVRGSISASALPSTETQSAVYFVHTPNLQAGKIIHNRTVTNLPITIAMRHGVVIPRVCKPNVKKVALLNSRKKYVLSDCVIAILTENAKDARKVKDRIVKNWDIFSKIYTGTGAQYTTIDTLKKIFGKV